MSARNNDHATAHKGGGGPDLQELEEPETLDVEIDGTDEGKWRRCQSRVVLAVISLMVVMVALGVSLGIKATGRTAVLVVWWDGAHNVEKDAIAKICQMSHSLLPQSLAKRNENG
jgi:hypothetical protein